MIQLVDAHKKYLKEYKEAYELSLYHIEQGNIRKHDLMFENIDEVDVIKKHQDSRDETKLKPGYVPSYDYFLVDNDKFLGVIHIRVRLTENLLRFGGHIGYGINPKYWRKGYGKMILKLGLEKAKELGLDERILVTCDDDNIGSSKIIEFNGGILENKVENEEEDGIFLTRRYWIENK